MVSPGAAHGHSFALEKYMLLQGKHEELSSHLQQMRPRQGSASIRSSSTSSSSSSSSSSSPSSPKTHTKSSQYQDARPRARCSGYGAGSLDTIVDEETLHQISAEEQRLFHVNEGIKRALTELLNFETVRGDDSMRMWAQARLMETERELRSGRRRRKSPHTE